jgi:hypothetical protein
MRAADDFKSIRDRMLVLRCRPKIDPALCQQHSFNPVDGRCIYCNLHYFHLPALQNRKPPEANAGIPLVRGSAE